MKQEDIFSQREMCCKVIVVVKEWRQKLHLVLDLTLITTIVLFGKSSTREMENILSRVW
jgi:hypothetical protein